MIILDRDGVARQINHAASKILHSDPKNLIGRSLEDLPLSRDDAWRKNLLETFRSREKQTWEGQAMGRESFATARLIPLHDEDEFYMGSLLTLEDASLSVSVREYLTEAEKHQYTAELAAGVVHEVNNPLGIINNYLEILKMKDRDDDDLMKLEKIQAEIRRITQILGSLLNFSRLPRSGATDMDLANLMDEVLLLLGHHIAQKNIRLEKVYKTRPAHILGQENRLKQVFINLLLNSVEAVIDPGRITVELSLLGNFHRVRVSDNGHGIPHTLRDSIFQPFFTTKLTKTNTGLGLSICDHIVKAHGGRLSCESVPGEWTSFDILLPRESPAPGSETDFPVDSVSELMG